MLERETNLRDLRPGSKVRSDHMMDWQYPSLGDLEQNKIFSKRRDSEMVFSIFSMRYFSEKTPPG